MSFGGLAACDLGGGDGDGGDDNVDVPDDSNLDAIPLCEASLSLTGTRTVDGTPPAEGGCYPLGTWTVNVALGDQGDCTAAVAFEEQYVYTITQLVDDIGDPAGFDVTFPADAANDKIFLKVTGDGSGCEGSFEHWSADGTQLLVFHPYTVIDLEDGDLESDVIIGQGDYTLYRANQFE